MIVKSAETTIQWIFWLFQLQVSGILHKCCFILENKSSPAIWHYAIIDLTTPIDHCMNPRDPVVNVPELPNDPKHDEATYKQF